MNGYGGYNAAAGPSSMAQYGQPAPQQHAYPGQAGLPLLPQLAQAHSPSFPLSTQPANLSYPQPGMVPPPGLPQHPYGYPTPHQQHQPPPRQHAGLGYGSPAQSQPQRPSDNLPMHPAIAAAKAAQSANPSGLDPRTWLGDKFSLYIGSIADGISDSTLEHILNAAGPLLQLRRIKDPSGKPKAFGFADYIDLSSVLRALALFTGLKLSGKGGNGETKALMLKADTNLRAKLDKYEADLKAQKKQELEHDNLERARDALKHVLDRLKEAGAQGGLQSTDGSGDIDHAARQEAEKLRLHNHLRDLGPDDLPEESRQVITSEIAFFRQRAAKKEFDQKTAEIKKFTAASAAPSPNVLNSGRPAAHDSPRSDGRRDSPLPYDRRDTPKDPQSLSDKPVAFTSGLSDEDQERMRIEDDRREAAAAYRQREARWTMHERNREAALAKEKQRERQAILDQDREHAHMRDRLAHFDDDQESAKGRELFLTDRVHWRKLRSDMRARERELDERDARAEAEQLEAVKRDSEDFLNKQAEMFNRMTAGAPEDSGPIKLNFAGPTKPDPNAMEIDTPQTKAPTKPKESASVPRLAAPAVFDDDDDATAKKKRSLIPLDYSEIEEAETRGMSETQKKAWRTEKLKHIVSTIPVEKEPLFAMPIKWSYVDSAFVEKLGAFVIRKTVEYLGVEDDDLVSAVVEHVKAHKAAQALTDEFEDILGEEAAEFVMKIYRWIILETLAREAKIAI
ncbi:uncharacterized protein L969DRAFT_94885 [Mixia osmundae IAM 14324]|uniref:PWI domain-containing protein n=1 Tax=Mixia osmundae (strain CBS 9802 / IAM 14324 / JCM 22182 / KY 12970) TaxID=764103 RepID=G7E214_MIXOS|nr:uncharacterized protein L969DRAFT_94885 [Mixia osmundae IAM 14324]KEI38689.1 hypothetical protein L969DRAFT_94885 [Mixia osmundae IAM 14324]GAA96851.1 hypothetical protein E5Q_03524 [Mixia osmundae IAM 14324]